MSSENVAISSIEYERLLEDQLWLQCLEEAGVDNWDGIDIAHQIKREVINQVADVID